MPGIRNKLKELASNVRNPAWLCFVWFGMTAGISLLEAPVKSGIEPAPSIAHAAYAITELTKLLLLLVLGFRSMRIFGLQGDHK